MTRCRKRCHSVASIWRQEEAEILGVAVDCTDQPESDLSLHEGQPVLFGIVTAGQETETFSYAWSALIVVLAFWRHRQASAMPLIDFWTEEIHNFLSWNPKWNSRAIFRMIWGTRTALSPCFLWCRLRDSNPRPSDYNLTRTPSWPFACRRRQPLTMLFLLNFTVFLFVIVRRQLRLSASFGTNLAQI